MDTKETEVKVSLKIDKNLMLEIIKKSVLAQYHRWYQVYEVPFTNSRIANQKDILDEDVEITSQSGTSKGKANLEERLKPFTGWLNAHHVQSTKVEYKDDNHLSLEAEIVYQNIRPDDSKYSYKIKYSTILVMRENDLPIFTHVNLMPIENISEFVYAPAYPENRCKSFLYYWNYLHALSQCNLQNVSEKFKELLSSTFTISSSFFETINTHEGLMKVNEAFKFKYSNHFLKTIKVVENKDDSFTVYYQSDWQGITLDDIKKVSETDYELVLENNMDERFARLKSLKVTPIKPIQEGEW